LPNSRAVKKWHGRAGDPNTGDVRLTRGEVLRRVRKSAGIEDRAAHIIELAKDRKVLDCGMVEHTLAATESPNWLHGRIRSAARECLGVDILEDEVNALREKGYNVRTLDVTREALPETFDLIVSCEIIEHIDNLGLAFKNFAKMLAPGGRLVITTPYPWYLNCMLKNLRTRSQLSESVDHVAWHEPFTLYELSQRYGLRMDCYTGLLVTRTYTPKAKLFFALSRLLIGLGFKYELFSKSLLFEFVKDS
jgi:SAM-dependent methyltransferase